MFETKICGLRREKMIQLLSPVKTWAVPSFESWPWARYLEVTWYQPLYVCGDWTICPALSPFESGYQPSGIPWSDPLLTLLRAFQAKGLSGTDNLLWCLSRETDWVWTFCDQQFNLNHFMPPPSICKMGLSWNSSLCCGNSLMILVLQSSTFLWKQPALFHGFNIKKKKGNGMLVCCPRSDLLQMSKYYEFI